MPAVKSKPAMTTCYFKNSKEAIKRTREAGEQPDGWNCGITLSNEEKGWDIYRGDKVIEQCSILNPCK